MKIARVFPRRNKATPTDPLVFTAPPGLFPPEVDAVHVSVAFTEDLRDAEDLALQWKHVAPVTIGGPACGTIGGEFTPGMYIKEGYTITSRGCPNHCWFCLVPEREPRVTEFPIKPGWNLIDDNILACSEGHIRAVFAMLKAQPRQVCLSGGLEAKRLRPWHVDLLVDLHPDQMFLAFDTPDDEEPLRAAAQMLREAGFNRHELRCFCLIGYKGDTFEKAEKRIRTIIELGFYPFAMLYKKESEEVSKSWQKFQRDWAAPVLIAAKLKEEQCPTVS